MKKNFVKTMCLCLSMFMLIGLLSACGTNKKAAVPTITWVMRKPVSDMSRQDLVEEEANKIIEKELGVKLKFEFIDSGAWDSKINAMIAAGEEFDLVLEMGAPYVNNVRKNAYIAVDEHIDKYGADIKAKVNDFAWKATEFDGKHYGIPSQTFYVPYSSFAFKKDLVEKYNFDYKNVKSYKELEPFLKTIKEKEPGMYPIIAVGPEELVQPKTTEYIKTDMQFMIYDKANDKFILDVESPYSLERYKTAYEYNQKGYIAKDAASKTEITSEIKSGKYAVFAGRRSATKTTNLYGFGCVESNPTYGSISTDNISNSITAVSRTSKNPDKAVQLLNLIWKNSDLSNMLAYGIEGMDYTVESGKGTPDMKIKTNSGNDVKWSIWHNWLGPLWDQWDSPWNSKQSLKEMQELNATAEISPNLGFRSNLSEYKTELAMLNSIFTETKTVFNTGSMVDFDEYAASVKKRYKEAGSDKVLAEVEKQYSAWKANP